MRSVQCFRMISKKCKGLFVEVNGFSYQLAAVTSLSPPLTVESITEVSRQEPEKLREMIGEVIGPAKNRFLRSHCGIVPESRFFRLHTIESLAKAKEPQYFLDLLESQYRINPKSVRASAVSASTGLSFDGTRPLATQKELMICGADIREFEAFQDNLVECGVYPASLQLSTLSSLGAMKNYLRSQESADPVLLVEMTQNSSHLFILSKDRIDLCRPVNFGFNSVLPTIQKELGLQDEESARGLFFSDTFDFRELGSKLLRRMLKELHASSGFYEVQTGQTIPHVYMTLLPRSLHWIAEVIAAEMEMNLLDINWENWLQTMGVSIGGDLSIGDFDASRFGLAGLFGSFSGKSDAVEKQKEN